MFEKLLFTKDTTDRESIGKTAGVFGIICNAVLCIIKLIAGVIAGSVSIIADAFNNLSDALSSLITVICFKMSGKPADEDHPYGHERIEYVATLLLAFFILFIGYELVKTSVDRIINPHYTALSIAAVIILVISIIGKLFMNRMYLTYAQMIDSAMLRATAQDCMNDVFSTGAVLVSVIIAAVFDIRPDGYVGAVVSALIMWSGITLIKDALDPILGSAPDAGMVRKLSDKIQSYDGVIGIHDLIVHSYGPSKTFASVHAEVDAKGDILASHDIIDNIERDVHRETGIELVIHMDPIVTDDESVDNAKKAVSGIISDIDGLLSMHDFRMVPGNTHTNLIFDVVLPFGFKISQKEIFEKIQEAVHEELGNEFFCVINFDRSYIGNTEI